MENRRTVFRKLVYRILYKDERSKENEHLGILGPVVTITPDAPVFVTLMNVGPKPVSIHPGAGIRVTLVEGEVSPDGMSVAPEKTAKFIWELPENFRFSEKAPNVTDLNPYPECTATLYTSHHDKVGDLYAGLMGPILICPKEREQSPMEFLVRRLFTSYFRFDEARSSLQYLNRLTEEERTSQSLVFDTVNGRLMGDADRAAFEIYSKQTVDWYMFAVGDVEDLHSIHFSGASFTFVDHENFDSIRVSDSMVIFPGQSVAGLAMVGRMKPLPPGIWPIQCQGKFI